MVANTNPPDRGLIARDSAARGVRCWMRNFPCEARRCASAVNPLHPAWGRHREVLVQLLGLVLADSWRMVRSLSALDPAACLGWPRSPMLYIGRPEETSWVAG